jgi:hypothetical protein
MSECGVCGDSINLFSWSTYGVCEHVSCGSCAVDEMVRRLQTGPFPLECSGCRFMQIRTLVAPGLVASLVASGDLSKDVAGRIEWQEYLLDSDRSSSSDDSNISRAIDDDASIALIYSTSDPCPNCNTPITHFRNHGCHHITPGSGCPVCGHHFCYHCLEPWDDHDQNECGAELFCDDKCDCPECPECQPGYKCDLCDGCPACQISESSEY